MPWLDLLMYSLLVGLPVLALVELLIYFSEKNAKAQQAENDRIKRELSRNRHPSNDEGGR